MSGSGGDAARMSSAAPGGAQPPASPGRGGGGASKLDPLLPLPRCRCRRRRGPGAPLPKALPPGPPFPGGATDVFVTTRTDFRAQLRRCQRLLLAPPAAGGGSAGAAPPPQEPPPQELRLHGLGLAVPRAINLALQLLAAAPPGTLSIQASTSSVPLLCPPRAGHRRDPSHPAEEEEEEEEEEEGESGEGAAPPRLRHNSAIHIRVCREGT